VILLGYTDLQLLSGMHIFAEITLLTRIKMKKLLLLLGIALATLVSCESNPDEGSSLEGRWNISRGEQMATDYIFSLIFKGNNLDLYITAWGEHFEGTYTYANNEVTYNITKASKAWTDVSYDENGKMISYSWLAGNMDQETFKLAEGYAWYPMADEDLKDRKEMIGKFKFELTSDTTASTDLMGEVAVKAK